MSKPIPHIRAFMTVTPETLSPSSMLTEAHHVMREKRIRHLPVCDGARVVGMISDGDLFRAESMSGVDPSRVTVKDVMSAHPYTVSPEAPIDEVVREMAGKKLSATVVVDNGKVVGLFTATDALNAFADLLKTRLAH